MSEHPYQRTTDEETARGVTNPDAATASDFVSEAILSRSIIAEMRAGLIVIDTRGQLLLHNQAALEILGLDSSELAAFLTHLPNMNVIDEDGAPFSVEMYPAYRALQTGEAVRQVVMGILRPDRSERLWLQMSAVPQANAEGMIERVICTFDDITKLKGSEEKQGEQVQLFEKIVAIARATTESPSLEVTLKNLLSISLQLTRTYRGDLFMLDDRGQVVQNYIMRNGSLTKQNPVIIDMVMEQGLAGWVARHRTIAIIDDTLHDERWFHASNRRSFSRSALCVPIISGASLQGILTLMHDEPAHFTPNDAQLMRAAVDQMALAIHNARLFDLESRLAEQQHMLYEVLRIIGGHHEPDRIAHTAIDAITRFAGWPNILIALPDPANRQWYVAAVGGSILAASGKRYPLNTGVIGRAFSTGRTELVPDTERDGTYIRWGEGIKSELAVPIRHGGQVLGVLNIESDSVDAFDARDVALAESLSDAVALALANAQLYISMQQELVVRERAERELLAQSHLLKAVAEANGLLLTRSNHVVGINEALEILGKATGTDRVYVFQSHPDPETGELAFSQRFEWVADPVLSRIDRPQLQNILYSSVHLVSWHKVLIQGRPVGGPVSLFQGAERQRLQEQGIRSLLAIPIIVDENFWGFIGYDDCRDERIWTATEESILTVAAASIGGAIVRKLAEDAVRDSEAKLRAIIENTSDAVYVKDLAGRYMLINPAGAEFMGYPAERIIGAHDNELVEPKLARRIEALDRSVMAKGLRQVYEITSTMGNAERIYHTSKFPYLTHQGELLGLIGVSRDITEYRRYEEALRRQNEYLAALHETSLALMNRLDLSGLLESIVTRAGQLMGTAHGFICLFDANKGWLEVQAATGMCSGYTGYHIRMGEGLAGKVLESGELIVTSDYQGIVPHLPFVRDANLKTGLAVPLTTESRITGVLALLYPQADRSFDENEIEIIQRFAQFASLALDNVNLYTAVGRRLNELTTVQHVARAINSTLRLDEIFQTVVDQIDTAFGYQLVAIYLLDDEVLQLKAQVGYTDVIATIELGRGVLGQVALSGSPVFVHDATREHDFLYADRSVTQGIYIPLKSPSGNVLGTLSLESGGNPGLSQDDFVLLTLLADQISVAVENARLFQAVVDESSRLHALIESSRDGVMLIGTDRRIMVTNAPALRMIGLADDTAAWIGRPVEAVLRLLQRNAPDVHNAIAAEMRRIRQWDEPLSEADLVLGSSTLHWLNLPVMAGALPLGRLIVIRDVSEERALEALREDLTRTMVHDLRNPLQALSTSIALMLESTQANLNPEQRMMLDVADRSTRRIINMVNDILDASRLESGRMPISFESFTLHEIVQEIFEMDRSLATQKEITLISEIGAEVPAVYADQNLIQRVLQNLIENAIKFTPPGGTVRVRAGLSDGNAGTARQVRISVSDTGPGIPQELQHKIFEKFVTGRNHGRGSGLGLAFCRLAIEAHNQQIWVESSQAGGTIFSFNLDSGDAGGEARRTERV